MFLLSTNYLTKCLKHTVSIMYAAYMKINVNYIILNMNVSINDVLIQQINCTKYIMLNVDGGAVALD